MNTNFGIQISRWYCAYLTHFSQGIKVDLVSPSVVVHADSGPTASCVDATGTQRSVNG